MADFLRELGTTTKSWLVIAAMLATGCAPPSLALDPDLVGVWIDTTGKSRIEIDQDGNLILWSYQHARILRGKGARLIWENNRRIAQTGEHAVQMPLFFPLIANRNGSSSLWHSKNRTKAVLVLEEGKWRGKTIDGSTLLKREEQVNFTYTIEVAADNVNLTLKPQGGPGHEIRLEKLLFDRVVDRIDNGSFDMHRNQATTADLIRFAAADTVAFNNVLQSPRGAFLAGAGEDRTTGDYPTMAANRLYTELINTGNPTLLDALLLHTRHVVVPENISARMPPPVIKLLRRKAGLSPETRDRRTLGDISHLLYRVSYSAYQQPFSLKLMYEKDGCSPLNDTAAYNRAERGPFTLEEQAALEEYHQTKRSDNMADQRTIEAAMTACLRNFRDGEPVAANVLNGVTSPGYQVVNGITTPLYYFASRQIPLRNPSAPEPYFGFVYSMMKAMVNAGADPSIKPTPQHPDLITYLHQQAPDYFDDMITNTSRGNRRGAPYAELAAFNELMDLLGGPHYGKHGGESSDVAHAHADQPAPAEVEHPTPAVVPSVPAGASKPTPGTTAPEPSTPHNESKTPPPEEVIGYWDYDGIDGTQLIHGLVLRSEEGSGLGQSWSHHLELKTHAELPPRRRTLWPVRLLRKARKVCVDYPNYPTYDVHISLIDATHDGVYRVGRCE